MKQTLSGEHNNAVCLGTLIFNGIHGYCQQAYQKIISNLLDVVMYYVIDSQDVLYTKQFRASRINAAMKIIFPRITHPSDYNHVCSLMCI